MAGSRTRKTTKISRGGGVVIHIIIQIFNSTPIIIFVHHLFDILIAFRRNAGLSLNE
jgi:hypothetical protein